MKEKERATRRFSKAKYGEVIGRLYSTMKTADLARKLGVKTRAISEYVYREEKNKWGSKDSFHRTKIARENGSGRPKNKSK